MGGSLDLTDHTCLTGIVFSHYFTRQPPCPKTEIACATNSLVSKKTANLFRRPGSREGNTLHATLFSNIRITDEQPKTTDHSLPLPLSSFPSRLFVSLIRIKSSLGVTEKILRNWLFSEANYLIPPGLLHHRLEMPIFANLKRVRTENI